MVRQECDRKFKYLTLCWINMPKTGGIFAQVKGGVSKKVSKVICPRVSDLYVKTAMSQKEIIAGSLIIKYN